MVDNHLLFKTLFCLVVRRASRKHIDPWIVFRAFGRKLDIQSSWPLNRRLPPSPPEQAGRSPGGCIGLSPFGNPCKWHIRQTAEKMLFHIRREILLFQALPALSSPFYTKRNGPEGCRIAPGYAVLQSDNQLFEQFFIARFGLPHNRRKKIGHGNHLLCQYL